MDERKVSDGNASPGMEIYILIVLNLPAGLVQSLVNLLSRFVFRCRHVQRLFQNRLVDN